MNNMIDKYYNEPTDGHTNTVLLIIFTLFFILCVGFFLFFLQFNNFFLSINP
jgi:hypothetical protein